MQAFAENTDGKLTVENKDDNSNLFSSDEIIFPDGNIERPYTRYGYNISDMNFLVPEKMVSEVIQSPNIFDLPNSPSWIEGLINVRGNIVPVMNIGKLLKEISHDKTNVILILINKDNEPTIGIIINDLPVSLEVNENKSNTKGSHKLLEEFIRGGFSQNNLDWLEFNPQDLFQKLANKDKQ